MVTGGLLGRVGRGKEGKDDKMRQEKERRRQEGTREAKLDEETMEISKVKATHVRGMDQNRK